MPTIQRYQLYLAIIPFAVIILASYYLDLLPKASTITRLLDLMIEKDLEELMLKNGLTKTSVKTFQTIRWFTVVAFSLLFFTFSKSGSLKKITTVALIVFICYKFWYIWLKMKESSRISKMNDLLPYTIKTIAYLTYVYPVSTAIQKAIHYCPKEYEYDLKQLLVDIYNDPVSKQPYKAFSERYNHKLHMLDTYLDQIYRLDQSGGKSSEKLLDTLNQRVSGEITRVRKVKNRRINSTVTYLGFIPVILMTAMLVYLLVIFTMSSF